jgi:hypothetical protein
MRVSRGCLISIERRLAPVELKIDRMHHTGQTGSLKFRRAVDQAASLRALRDLAHCCLPECLSCLRGEP